VSRISRLPYHQNVYDLLRIERKESPLAARLIAAHEATHAPLPAAVREWYLIRKMVPLTDRPGVPRYALGEGSIWFAFSNMEQVAPLTEILAGFAAIAGGNPDRFVQFLCENQGVVRWWLEANGSDDPPVWVDNDVPDDPSRWTQETATFSEFVFRWFATFGFHPDYAVIHETEVPRLLGVRKSELTPHANGLWLRSPAEPFVPPVLDYLTEQIGEPERIALPGGVTRHTFRPSGGSIRVTADDPALSGGLSAWWIHADSDTRLAELGRFLLSWGPLRDTLRADLDPGRAVLATILE
jgi:hypothetical protein